MNELTFRTLRDASQARLHMTDKFKECRHWDWEQWLIALMGEVGEAASLVKQVNRGDIRYGPESREEFGKELADIAIYLDLLANCAGVDLGQAVVDKFNEVSDRHNAPVRIIENGGDWIRERD